MLKKLRNSMTARIGVGLMAATGVLAAGGAADLKDAAPAEAATYSNCSYDYVKRPGGSFAYTTYQSCDVRYTVQEKLRYPFPRDGRYRWQVPLYT